MDVEMSENSTVQAPLAVCPMRKRITRVIRRIQQESKFKGVAYRLSLEEYIDIFMGAARKGYNPGLLFARGKHGQDAARVELRAVLREMISLGHAQENVVHSDRDHRDGAHAPERLSFTLTDEGKQYADLVDNFFQPPLDDIAEYAFEVIEETYLKMRKKAKKGEEVRLDKKIRCFGLKGRNERMKKSREGGQS